MTLHHVKSPSGSDGKRIRFWAELCGGSGAVTWCHALHMLPGLTAHHQRKDSHWGEAKLSYDLCQHSHQNRTITMEGFGLKCCQNLPWNSHREWKWQRVFDLPHTLGINWIYHYAGIHCGVQLIKLPCVKHSLLLKCHSKHHARGLGFPGPQVRTLPIDQMEDRGLILFWDNTLVIFPRPCLCSQGYTCCIVNLRLILPLLLSKYSVYVGDPDGVVSP